MKECYFFIDNKIDASPKALLIRMQELLAQPEQPEQEPLSVEEDELAKYKFDKLCGFLPEDEVQGRIECI